MSYQGRNSSHDGYDNNVSQQNYSNTDFNPLSYDNKTPGSNDSSVGYEKTPDMSEEEVENQEYDKLADVVEELSKPKKEKEDIFISLNESITKQNEMFEQEERRINKENLNKKKLTKKSHKNEKKKVKGFDEILEAIELSKEE